MIELLLEYKQYILLLHVFATTLGLGGAIVTDLMFMRFLKDYRVSAEEKDTLDNLSLIIWSGLGLLVLTGLLLFLPQASVMLKTPGFLAKMTSVAVILVNGVFLNFYVSPKLTSIVFNQPGANPPEVNRVRRLSPIFGGISIVSWTFTFFLGVMNAYLDYSYAGFMLAYGVLLLLGITFTFTVTKIKFKPSNINGNQQQ